jgi:uncharacterized RDD family membrane protein YckC
MKSKIEHMPNQPADFVIDKDLFGQIKNWRTSVVKRSKYKSTIAPDLNVTYAGLVPRTFATTIDLAIVVGIVLLINMLFFNFGKVEITSFWIQLIGGSLVWVVYNASLQSSFLKATIGQLIVKINVIDFYGMRIGFLRAMSRCMLTIISILPLGLGIWYMTTDPKKQSWHDLIACTFVIKL